jgi:hypothetical protein
MGRRHGEQLEPLADEIRASGGAARSFTLDARQEEQGVELFDRIEEEIGPSRGSSSTSGRM